MSERGLFAALDDAPALQPAARRPDPPSSRVPVSVPGAGSGAVAASRAAARLARTSLLPTARAAFALEADRGTAFLFVPVLLAAGCVAYFALPGEPGLIPVSAAALVALALAMAARRRPLLSLVAAAVLLLACGVLLAKLETWRAGTKVMGAEITTLLTGRVVAIEPMASGRMRLTLDVVGTERPVLRFAPDRVRVTARRVPEGAAAGSLVSGLVRLMPPAGPVRPGSYDFSFESYFDGIGASGFFMSGPKAVVEAAPPGAGWRGAIENFRDGVAWRIRDRIGGAEGEVAAALIVGVRAGIPDALAEAMRTAGLYHVISISGLHMALVAGTLMFLLRGGFALFPDFSARHPVKKLSAVIALAGITGYLLVSGGEVAAQRSYVMLAVMLVAILFDRAALTLRNLAISALVVIAISPHEVVGPSFQMSFAATAALVGAYGAWSEFSDRRRGPPASLSIPGRIWRHAILALAGLAATSLVAGFSTSIFSVYHFQRVAPLSLLANLAAMPVVSLIVMPSAVLATMAMPFGADGPFLDLMGVGIKWMGAIAQWVAARSPADSVGVVPGASVLLLTAALVLATLGTTWLRAAALLPAAAGLLLLGTARTPDILVSEDARLVAVAFGDGSLAFNRARPGSFTADNWQRAMDAPRRIAPVDIAGPDPSVPIMPNPAPAIGPGTTAPAPKRQAVPKALPEGFACRDGLCLLRHSSGLVVAHAANAQALARACGEAGLIVVDDPTVRRRCAAGRARIITGRDLAREGAIAVYIDAKKGRKPMLTMQAAVSRPYRPWHEHRAFSRAARGLAPYVRKRANPPAGDVSNGG